MKYLILLLLPFGLTAQPGIDSATQRGNELLNWKKGISTGRGTQNLRYYSTNKNYYSVGAGTAANPNIGGYNLAIGDHAGDSLSGGSHNTFFGRGVGQRTKTGNFNFAASWDALRDNISGNSNTAIGEDALRSNQRGSNNVGLGNGAQFSNIAGNHNISAGNQSLYYLTSGNENVAIGGYAGAFLLKGSGNVYIGQYAGEHNDAAVGKIINNSIYIGNLTGISSAHSGSINIGFNVQSTGDNKINIGGVYKGDIVTGTAEVSSITISGRKISFDDNYMYVVTSTGETKRVPLEATASTARAIITNDKFALYDTQGRLLGFYKMIRQ